MTTDCLRPKPEEPCSWREDYWRHERDAAEQELRAFERRVQTAAGQIQAWATENRERAARARGRHERDDLLEIAGAYEHAAEFLRETFPRRWP